MLNHIVVMGRLTRDPELRKTASGISVASFSVAVDRDFSQQDGSRETDFLDVVAWKNTAEFAAKYFSKGRMAVVSGRLQIRSWEDKEGTSAAPPKFLPRTSILATAKKTMTQEEPRPHRALHQRSRAMRQHGRMTLRRALVMRSPEDLCRILGAGINATDVLIA